MQAKRPPGPGHVAGDLTWDVPPALEEGFGLSLADRDRLLLLQQQRDGTAPVLPVPDAAAAATAAAPADAAAATASGGGAEPAADGSSAGGPTEPRRGSVELVRQPPGSEGPLDDLPRNVVELHRQALAEAARPHLQQLITQLLTAEGVMQPRDLAAATEQAQKRQGGAAPEAPSAAAAAEEPRADSPCPSCWVPVLLALAEGAAAALSPALCSGPGMMDPRHYIKVGL